MARREIWSGIPVPDVLAPRGPSARVQAGKMEIGDCLLDYTPNAAHSAARSWSKIYFSPREFVARKLPDDVRPDLANRYGVWRVK